MLERARQSQSVPLALNVESDGSAATVRLQTPAGVLGEAWLAISESGFETAVGRGENADRVLYNDHVVRKLLSVPLDRPVTLALDPSWKRKQLRLVAFLQDPSTLAVTGATEARWP